MPIPDEPPKPGPLPVPPNRTLPAGSRWLIIWSLVIVAFVALYQFSQPVDDPPEVPALIAEVTESQPIPRWPLLLPVATLAVLALAFHRVRARLPPQFRTLELRVERVVEVEPAPPTVPPSMTPIEVEGESGDRKAKLRVDDTGLRWVLPSTLLRGAQELEIGWDEVDRVMASAKINVVMVWGIVIAIFGFFYGAFQPPDRVVEPGDFFVLGAGVSIAIVSLFFPRRGTLTIVTKTHQLLLASRSLDVATRAAILAAARTRRPPAKPPRPESHAGGLTAPKLLPLMPLTEIGYLRRSPESILSEVDVATFESPDVRNAFVEQRRLLALWTSGLYGWLPVSIGVADALMRGPPSCFSTWFLAWGAGLVAATKLMPIFARLSGTSLRC